VIEMAVHSVAGRRNHAYCKARNLLTICRTVNILVAPADRPEKVKSNWIWPGANVMNAGVHRISLKDGPKLVAYDEHGNSQARSHWTGPGGPWR